MDGVFKPPLKANTTDAAFGVSIVIPCHGCAGTLLETVQSIIKVKPRDIPLEIIMVDDDPDNPKTRAACARAVHECFGTGIYVNLRTHDKNKGASAARNTGIVDARYKYIWPIDSDDTLPADSRFIEKSVDILEKDQDTVFVYPGMRYTGALKHRPLVPFFSEKNVLVRNSIPCCAMMRRDEVLAVGGYDETIGYGEDQELGLALLAQRHHLGPQMPRRVRRLLSETYLYRQHDSGATNATRKHLPQWTWPTHMAKLVTRAGPLYDLHYGTRDPAAVRMKFALNGGNIIFTAARRVQACLAGERPLRDLFRVPKALRTMRVKPPK